MENECRITDKFSSEVKAGKTREDVVDILQKLQQSKDFTSAKAKLMIGDLLDDNELNEIFKE